MKLPTAALALFVAASAASSSHAFSVAPRRSNRVPSTTTTGSRGPAFDASLGMRGWRSSSAPYSSALRVHIEEDIEIISGSSPSNPSSSATSPSLSRDADYRNGYVPMDHAEAALSRKQARRSASDYLKRYEGQSAASVIYTKLQENGIRTVNGYSGGAVLPLLDQFHVEHPRHSIEGAPSPIRWITNSNESSSGHIAEG